MPTANKVPLFVNRYFGEFYQDLFHRAYNKEGRSAVFLEYAWNVSPMQGVKCDPCVSPPPVFGDFATAGVNWVTGMNYESQVFFTRLHVRYTKDRFPQDLQFQVTPNAEHFQARYIITHPAKGDLNCEAGDRYVRDLENRRSLEVKELAALAGWTNPNYADYVTEYSKRFKPDKYAPQRNSFLPSAILPSADDGSDWAKWLFPLVVLAGVLFLRPKRKREEA
jgi:MYXO-CTERM domain-containing protein